MHEQFTDRSRKVLQLAHQEAQRLQHNCIGSEHVLLGLVQEGTGLAVHVLKNLGVELPQITSEVERLIKSGVQRSKTNTVLSILGRFSFGRSSGRGANGKGLPYSVHAKRVVQYAMNEALSLKDKYVGTEHMLLGLVHDDVGLSAIALMNLGLYPGAVRAELFTLLGRAEVPH